MAKLHEIDDDDDDDDDDTEDEDGMLTHDVRTFHQTGRGHRSKPGITSNMTASRRCQSCNKPS